MDRKAKLAILGILITIITAVILVIPLMSKAQDEAQVAYNNNLAFTPSEIKEAIPLTVEKDNNWQVEWHETYLGLTHREYEIAIQNQKDTSSQFDLSVIFDNLNFDATGLRNIELLEWKKVSREKPIYEAVQHCEYPSIIDNETGKETGNNTNCWSEQVSKGTETFETYEWVEERDLTSEQETAEVKQEAYNSVSFDGIKDKAEGNIKYFRLSFDVPIVQTENGWGNRGKVAFFEGNTQTEYHPIWDASYSYKRVINITNLNATTIMEENFTVNLTFSHASLVTAGKSLASGNDIRVVFNDTTEIDRINITPWNTATTTILFRTQANISGGATDMENYTIYYGNTTPSAPLADPNKVYFFFDHFTTDTSSNWFVSGGSITINTSSGGWLNFSVSCLNCWYFAKLNCTKVGIKDIEDMKFTVKANYSSYWAGILVRASIKTNNIYGFIFNDMDPASTGTTQTHYWTGDKPIDQKRDAIGLTRSVGYNITFMVFKTNLSVQWDDGASSYKMGNNTNSTNSIWGNGTIGFARYGSSGLAGAIWVDFVQEERYMDPYPNTTLNGEQSIASYANESAGDSAIVEGIALSAINSSYTAYYGQHVQIYIRNVTGQQQLGKFDAAAAAGNQGWLFNYVTSGDPTSNFTYMVNIMPVLYVWEASNLTATQIQQQVIALINSTKI